MWPEVSIVTLIAKAGECPGRISNIRAGVVTNRNVAGSGHQQQKTQTLKQRQAHPKHPEHIKACQGARSRRTAVAVVYATDGTTAVSLTGGRPARRLLI